MLESAPSQGRAAGASAPAPANPPGFFRHPETLEGLALLLGSRLASRRDDRAVRIWVPGCGTGEEVYTLAICIFELLQELKLSRPVKVFGTDVDGVALERARSGMYDERIQDEVSAERLRRFFVRMEGQYKITHAVRQTCLFARHDVMRDAPFAHLDVVSCRNLTIDGSPTMGRGLVPVFHYSLEPNGLLLLNPTATIPSAADLF